MDRYRYEEKCYYRHRYDTDPIIGGTLRTMPEGECVYIRQSISACHGCVITNVILPAL